MPANNISLILKQHRSLCNMTPEQVIDALSKRGFSISVKALYAYECGTNLPKVPVFLALCDIYNIRDIMGSFGYRGGIMAKFCDRLRSLRENHALSQLELSKFIGVSKSSINMYERGEREPGLETLESIADYFNVDMDYLLGKSDCENKYARYCESTPKSPAIPELKFTDAELTIIKKYRALDERGKAAVMNVLNFEYNSLPGMQAHPAPKQA